MYRIEVRTKNRVWVRADRLMGESFRDKQTKAEAESLIAATNAALVAEGKDRETFRVIRQGETYVP